MGEKKDRDQLKVSFKREVTVLLFLTSLLQRKMQEK